MLILSKDRFTFSDNCKFLANSIIKHLLPVKSITWCNESEELKPLDYLHGIDCIAYLEHGQPVTFQTKILTQDYDTITLECASTHDGHNDWSSCLAQFVLYVYSLDGKTIDRFALISNARLAISDNDNKIEWEEKSNRYGKSSFKYVKLGELLMKCSKPIVAYGGTWRNKDGKNVILKNRKIDINDIELEGKQPEVNE